MVDDTVRLGWRILKALPKDDSKRTYEAVLAVHSLVWKVWQLEAMTEQQTQPGEQPA